MARFADSSGPGPWELEQRETGPDRHLLIVAMTAHAMKGNQGQWPPDHFRHGAQVLVGEGSDSSYRGISVHAKPDVTHDA